MPMLARLPALMLLLFNRDCQPESEEKDGIREEARKMEKVETEEEQRMRKGEKEKKKKKAAQSPDLLQGLIKMQYARGKKTSVHRVFRSGEDTL